MRHSRFTAVAVAVTASFGVAACGSSNSSSNSPAASSSTPATSTPASSGTSSSALPAPPAASTSTTLTGTATTAGGTAKGTLTGAGSTFAAPFYEEWGQELSKQGLTLNYGALGSGAGVADLQSSTIDFAGSDPAMAPSDIKAAKGPVLQFPLGFGAITVSYNVQGLKTGLKLDGPTLANIFLGKIKSWNDPAIAKLNPGVSLPSQSITVVHRSDSSGTTEGFVTYLSANSPAWTAAAGAPSETPKWPTGTGAAKNSGVAEAIKQTPGAIGYVEQAYALQNGFTYAEVKNSAGQYVLPTLQAATAAAANSKVPANLTISTINAPGTTSYPITSQTFFIVYKDMCKAGRSAADAQLTKEFLSYGLSTGQKIEEELDYAPLPASLLAKDKAQMNEMQCNGSAIS